LTSFEVFSTENVQAGDRGVFWQGVLLDKFGLSSQVVESPTFSAKMEYGQWNEIGLFRLKAAGYYVRRARRSEERAPCVKIAYQIAGSSSFHQNGHGVELEPEEWTVFDDNQPYVSSNPQEVQLLILTIPMQRILSCSIDLHKSMGMRFSASQGIAKIAFNFILSALDEIAHVKTSQSQDLVDIISHLLMLSLAQVQQSPAKPTSMELLRERIKAYILENLRNPGLNIDQIASELGCSRRYLHKAFQGQSMTIADYMWSMRLARVRETLRIERSSITDVAYSWGFSSSAHFSTLFRQHFGQTPREYRAQAVA
jgi:AraC family transcriptional activator of tynA and feaB